MLLVETPRWKNEVKGKGKKYSKDGWKRDEREEGEDFDRATVLVLGLATSSEASQGGQSLEGTVPKVVIAACPSNRPITLQCCMECCILGAGEADEWNPVMPKEVP